MQQTIIRKETLGVVLLVIVALIGVGHVLRPDRFMPSHLVQTYRLPTARLTTRGFGVLIAGFAIYVLYDVYLRG
jgi:hypothetical protein